MLLILRSAIHHTGQAYQDTMPRSSRPVLERHWRAEPPTSSVAPDSSMPIPPRRKPSSLTVHNCGSILIQVRGSEDAPQRAPIPRFLAVWTTDSTQTHTARATSRAARALEATRQFYAHNRERRGVAWRLAAPHEAPHRAYGAGQRGPGGPACGDLVGERAVAQVKCEHAR